MQVDWADLPEWFFNDDNDLSGTVDITNTGNASLDWEITFIGDADDWMSASMTSGTLGAGESETITITCAKPTPTGIYTGSINVTAPGVETKTEAVTITAPAYTTSFPEAILGRSWHPGDVVDAWHWVDNTALAWSGANQYYWGDTVKPGFNFHYRLYPPNTPSNATDGWVLYVNDESVTNTMAISVTADLQGGAYYPTGEKQGNLTDGEKYYIKFGYNVY